MLSSIHTKNMAPPKSVGVDHRSGTAGLIGTVGLVRATKAGRLRLIPDRVMPETTKTVVATWPARYSTRSRVVAKKRPEKHTRFFSEKATWRNSLFIFLWKIYYVKNKISKTIVQLTIIFFNQTKWTATKFEGLGKKRINRTVLSKF